MPAQTLALFAACPVRSKAIAKGTAWLRRHRRMVESWAEDLRLDTATVVAAISADLSADPSHFEPADLWPNRGRHNCKAACVGFLSVAYSTIGGTETHHRTLLPRLRKVIDLAGFVATGFFGGDGLSLQVPYATGLPAAKQLAAHCNVLVVWGLSDLKLILPTHRPKVIAVHHADMSSGWSNDLILQQLDVIDEVVCVNEATSQRLASGKPTHFIPNAIDPQRIIPSGRQQSLRSQHNIPADAKIVLFGHRLSGEKRPEFAVEIARQLPAGWVMAIVGGGPMRHAIERDAADCDQVRVVGPCESLADWLSISDCFLSLSTFEGFGLSVGEALAAGVPTVSTATGIAPGLATTLPTFASALEWADAIVSSKVLVEPDVVLDRFNVDRMVAGWANVIRNRSVSCEHLV
jgi:hypothetical protein